MTTPAHAQVTPERIYQLAFAFAPTLILEAAIRQRVFDVLDQGPMSLQQLHAVTGSSERGLAAILNALTGLAFLAKDAQGNYSLTPESSVFLVTTKPSFQGGLLRHASSHLVPRWLHLNEVIETGRPVAAANQEADGVAFFEQFVNDIFPMSYPAAQALAAHLNLASAAATVSVLDLAAGSGVWGIALAQSSNSVRVTAVDWPGVLAVTRKGAARFGLAERFSFNEGDLLAADFGSGHNVATLGHILHSMGAEDSKTLLKRVFEALAPGGTIAIAEFLVNADRTGPMNGLLFAVNMLVNTENGDAFSFEEIASWLRDAGFTNPRKLEAPGPSPLILATRP
ncbi:MAG TPA: methyltransferase [Terracidiphilus sp.]|jgi:ubiquinone/menaquinone biosynthesis C-methylase UbiE